MRIRCLFSMCLSFLAASGLLLGSSTWEALVCLENAVLPIAVPSDVVGSAVGVASPAFVAITPDATKALVSDFYTNTITVLDLTTPIIGPGYTVPVGVGPGCIAITRDGTRALVANMYAGTVTVLDITHPTIGPGYSVSVGVTPQGVAITPDDTKAFVANTGDNSISVLDLNPTVHLLYNINGVAPSFVAITPDGTKALVSNRSSDTVTVLDLTQSIINSGYTVTVGGRPIGIGITPDGTKALVANSNGGTVSVLDLTQSTIVPGYAVPVGVGLPSTPQFIAITPDGARAYVTAEGRAGAMVVDVLDLTVSPIQSIHDIPVSSFPYGIAITPDQAPTSLFSVSFDGRTALFDGSGSSSLVGGIKEYIWNFGDGSSLVTTTSPTVSHTYAKSKKYTVTLTVVNDAGTSLDVTFTGQTVSNHGLPRARSSQVLAVPPLPPHKFVGEVRLHKHDKKVLMETKWHPSTDKSTKKYLITARNHKEEVIKGRKTNHATLELHPRHFPHKVSKKYRKYLHHKYKIQSVNRVGTLSQPVRVHIEH
jgi:YVTN family beta-propeller protein